MALGISTSGTSPNVLKALAVAKELGLKTAGLTGGLRIPAHDVVQYCDLLLNVPSRIQEAHLWIEHLLCELVERLDICKILTIDVLRDFDTIRPKHCPYFDLIPA